MNRVQYIQNLKNEIEDELILIQNYINSKKGTNRDISFIAELFIGELLDEIFKEEDFHFKNMNHEIPGYPAIDIADEKHGVSYQVTVTNDSSDLKDKVNQTLEMFYKHKFDEKYKELYIIVASGISNRKQLPQKKIFKINGEEVIVNSNLFSSKNIIDLTDLAKREILKSADKLERVLKVLQKIQNRPEKKIIPFNFNETYIKRTVNEIKNNQKILLADAVENNRLNVLLGVGGLGKTTEIDKLAHEFSKKEKCFCFKTKLIDYANSLERHIGAYCKNWQNVPNGDETFIILDGLDEVNSLMFDIVFKEIKEFAIINSDIKILVTCRTNFNPFSFVDENSNDDEKFNELFLNEINQSDINEYISKECHSPEMFLQASRKSKIEEIFRNPFYLVNAVDIFNSQNKVPESKSDFFRKLIKLRIEKEKRKNITFKKNLVESGLVEGLKMLALTMQYSGEYKIEKIDFERIIRNKVTRDNIERIFFNENEDYWQFEHNNFQEFLAAEAISEIGWEKIKKIILLPNNKLKPKWLNAFSFLVNLVHENSQLISWFIENETESLVKVEPDKIKDSIRNMVLKQIFEKHKKEETIFWRTPYSSNDLALFAKLENNKELISFLLQQLNSENYSMESISNAVHLLEQLNDPGKYRNEIQSKYLELLTDKENHKFGISYSILNSFIKWQLFEIELKNTLAQIETLFIKDSPLSSFCEYLSKGGFDEIDADLVYKIIQAMERNRVIGSAYSLFEVIKLLPLHELTHLIRKLTPNDFHGRPLSWNKDLFKQINTQAINQYDELSEIENVITDFIYSSVVYHDESYAIEFKSFYEKTNIVLSTFKNCFFKDIKNGKSKRREYFTVPALIADKECLDWAIDYYLKNQFPDEMMWNFLIALTHIGNREGHLYVLGKIKEPTKGRFEPQPNPYELFNKKKEELFLKVILDIGSTLQYIELGLNTFKKDKIIRSEVSEKLFNKEERFKNIDQCVGLELIRNHSDVFIHKQEFLNYFEENWEKLVIDEYNNRITYQIIPEENLKWLRNWCYKVLPSITFKDSLTEKTYLLLNYNFINYAIFLDLQMEEKYYLEMTSWLGFMELNSNFHSNTNEDMFYEYLRKHIPAEKLKNQLLLNLKEGKLVYTVLGKHIEIIEKENIKEAVELLPDYINNHEKPIYIRNRILDFYDKSNGNSECIIPILYTLTLSGNEDYFDWNVIDYFIKNERPEIIQFLINSIDKESIDQLKVGIYLLKARNKIAFDVIPKKLRLMTNHSENETLTLTISQILVNKFDRNELMNFLLIMIQIYTKRNFGSFGFNNILPTLFNKIFELITKTNLEENLVLKNITKILDSCEKNETSRRARYELYELENKINIHNDKGCQISEAIKELKELGIEYEF